MLYLKYKCHLSTCQKLLNKAAVSRLFSDFLNWPIAI